MKDYSNDSEQKNRLMKSIDSLENIDLCKKCSHLSLPLTKSTKDEKISFCKSCYYFLENEKEDNNISTNDHFKLLERLIYSCENFDKGCPEEFTVNTLENLFLHQKNCNANQDISQLNKCLRCVNISYNNSLHIINNNSKNGECGSSIRQAYQVLKKEILVYVQESLIKQGLLFEMKIKKLEDTTLYQAKEINQLKQIIQNKENEGLKNQALNLEEKIKKLEEIILSQAVDNSQLRQILESQQKTINNQMTDNKKPYNNSVNNQDNHTVHQTKSGHKGGMKTKGHRDSIHSLVELNDGSLVSSSSDKTIKLWDLNAVKCTITLKGHQNAVYSLIELNDGKIASASADKTIKIWDLSTNQCTLTLKGHTSTVSSLVLTNDGKIASCSWDKTIKIWDIIANVCILTLEGHNDYVSSLIQLKDQRLASCSYDKSIKLWG